MAAEETRLEADRRKALGLAHWAYLLETGQTPDGDSVGGSMTAVIRNTSQLAPEDRNAMVAYIKALAPVEGPKKPEKAEKK